MTRSEWADQNELDVFVVVQCTTTVLLQYYYSVLLQYYYKYIHLILVTSQMLNVKIPQPASVAHVSILLVVTSVSALQILSWILPILAVLIHDLATVTWTLKLVEIMVALSAAMRMEWVFQRPSVAALWTKKVDPV